MTALWKCFLFCGFAGARVSRLFDCKYSKLFEQFLQEVQRQLAQLILLNGMLTNPDLPGCEKVCGTFLNPAWLNEPCRAFDVEHDLSMDPNTLGPEKIFMVKGWNRSCCCLLVLFGCYKNEEILKATPSENKQFVFWLDLGDLGRHCPPTSNRCSPQLSFIGFQFDVFREINNWQLESAAFCSWVFKDLQFYLHHNGCRR